MTKLLFVHPNLLCAGVVVFCLFVNSSIAGNSQTIAESPQLFISEVGYAGSIKEDNCDSSGRYKLCSFDKWLELFNPGSEAVNLEGWSLLIGKKQVQEVFPSITIAPQSFLTINNGRYTYRTKNEPVVSTMASIIKTPGVQFSKLHFMGSNILGEKYIELTLQNQHATIVNSLSLYNLDELENQNSVNQNTQKTSLDFQSLEANPKFSTQSFATFNLGTPGFSTAPKHSPEETEKPVGEVVTTTPETGIDEKIESAKNTDASVQIKENQLETPESSVSNIPAITTVDIKNESPAINTIQRSYAETPEHNKLENYSEPESFAPLKSTTTQSIPKINQLTPTHQITKTPQFSHTTSSKEKTHLEHGPITLSSRSNDHETLSNPITHNSQISTVVSPRNQGLVAIVLSLSSNILTQNLGQLKRRLQLDKKHLFQLY